MKSEIGESISIWNEGTRKRFKEKYTKQIQGKMKQSKKKRKNEY